MAFQQPTSENSGSPTNTHYLISFVGSPCPVTDNQTASSLSTPSPSGSDILLAGQIAPVSESCLSAPPAYLRGASRRGDLRKAAILPSSSDYDANHPSLDAHSPATPPSTDLMETGSLVNSEFGFCSVGLFQLFVVSGTLCCVFSMRPQLPSHAT